MMTAPPKEIAGKESLPFAIAAATAPSASVAHSPTLGAMGYRGLVIVAAVAIAIVIPLLTSSFVTFQLTQVMVYALAILGLNLLTGYNGQFSLGHSAFYAIGA